MCVSVALLVADFVQGLGICAYCIFVCRGGAILAIQVLVGGQGQVGYCSFGLGGREGLPDVLRPVGRG